MLMQILGLFNFSIQVNSIDRMMGKTCVLTPLTENYLILLGFIEKYQAPSLCTLERRSSARPQCHNDHKQWSSIGEGGVSVAAEAARGLRLAF